MEFNIFQPDQRLKSFIDCYWQVEGNETGIQKVVADGHPELIFHFGERYLKSDDGKEFTPQDFCLVAGQLDKPIYLQPTGSSGMIGVKFHPTGMWKLFGWNLSLLKNEALSLSDLLPEKFIHERIKNCATTLERVHVINQWLLSKLDALIVKKPLDSIVSAIINSDGQTSVTRIASSFKIPPRSLERLFNEQVGVSPKRYARMIRFKKIYQLLQRDTLTKAEASYLCGYFDQAHFNKEFKSFSGEDAQSFFMQNNAFTHFLVNR